MSTEGVRVGSLVLHHREGRIGRIKEIHPPNGYQIQGRPVSVPVVVLECGHVFLDVPGKNAFAVLPDRAERAIELLRTYVDNTVSNAVASLMVHTGVDERTAMLTVGAVIRERMRKDV